MYSLLLEWTQPQKMNFYLSLFYRSLSVSFSHLPIFTPSKNCLSFQKSKISSFRASPIQKKVNFLFKQNMSDDDTNKEMPPQSTRFLDSDDDDDDDEKRRMGGNGREENDDEAFLAKYDSDGYGDEADRQELMQMNVMLM